ncbi:hypothetical protein BO86DRAFT_411379 [Aspergillus japonicus CBS 114.51]|uniref:Cytochrome b5 heme-binding domain-containing protein n=1 Tax=Aspergillus japonicus CBS 114.51 TaxID=1448312 RepID=A0A8T8WV32_ASPJA|nr:hypothetical protein BO86DRAFT_411379 [Aspergillus japonicus CBS 114.51]RAH79717.1 hypothetical protein BO86DRAFT_411379 [Aspergillus japonicus CBS 114.51]
MSLLEVSWHRKIRWIPTTLIILPICAVCLVPWVPLSKEVFWLMIGYGFHTGLCITAGYHRLWSHRAYRASFVLRLYLAIFGAAALEGPIRWWAREHRAHHRYTDTDEDPYSIRRGLFHAHLGWMVLAKPQAQPPGKTQRTRRHIDLSDLDADAVAVWQSRYYALLAVLMGWGFPTVVGGVLFRDWMGGLLYGGIIKMVLVHHSTFCINSLAHYLGDRPYDDQVTPRDSFLAAVLTLGEGYHNFHHNFPSDYRNGVRWYHYDCTKWAIAGWAKALTRRMEALPQAVPVEKLLRVDWAEYRGMVEKGRFLVAVDGVVHDVGAFMAEHLGGEHLIQAWVGKDATMAFHAGIYRHSKVARNILACMRVAVLENEQPGNGS